MRGFIEMILEADFAASITKLLGKADNIGKIGQEKEYTWEFKDSYLRLDTGVSRAEYYTNGGDYITSFTTVNQIKKYLEQSGLREF